MTSRRARPPDGGYGWVVVMSAFLVMGLTAAVLKNFGLFFVDIQSHFRILTSTTSWITATTIATFHLGAPVASALTLQFSQRVVITVGGLLTASGMLLASLDLSLPWLYVTMGILQGWLVDETKDYSSAFYLSGLCLISSAAFVVLADRRVRSRQAEAPCVVQAISQQEDREAGKVK